METVLLKIPDVMERLAVGQTKVYELMSSGELRSVKVGRSRRIPSDELERFPRGPTLNALSSELLSPAKFHKGACTLPGLLP